MARSTIEVPWDIGFPQVCARCTAPATKVRRIQRQKPSAQQWFFWFGAIGAAIASSRKGGSVRLEIPYCEKCHRQDRILLWSAWGAALLGLIFLCSFPALAAQLEETSDVAASIVGVLGVLGITLGILALLIAVPALVFARRAHQAVHIKRIDERAESVRLAFRSRPYFERFWRDNLEPIVSFVLRHGKPMPVPLDQAITVVGGRIDEQNPRSPESLSGYFERGQLYLQGGMYDRAVADLDRVVGVTGFENPHFLEAQFFHGRAAMQLGNTMQAQTDLENYVQASSDRAKVRQAKQWLKQLRRA
jgi:tetratricopeptide (TPR) repeat protein